MGSVKPAEEGGEDWMAGDAAVLAAQVMPYLSSAVGAYGGAVLADVRDEAADATVNLGRRLLQRLFGTSASGEGLPEPLADVVADQSDEDAMAALRLAVRKALEANAELRHDVTGMIASAHGAVTASGERSIAAQSMSGVAITGDASRVFNIGGSLHNVTVNANPAQVSNPAASDLVPRIVQIATLLPPGSGAPILRDRIFEDLHFFGPAMVFTLEGTVYDACTFDIDQNSIETILWEIQPRFGIGAIGLERCTFLRCRFTAIGFMGVKSTLDQFRAAVRPKG
jgi:hypothetical protein